MFILIYISEYGDSVVYRCIFEGKKCSVLYGVNVCTVIKNMYRAVENVCKCGLIKNIVLCVRRPVLLS